jgi:hypothetical protein
MKRTLLLFLVFLLSIGSIYARGFISNGINYNITSAVSPYNISVTSGGVYTGDVVIPSTVSYNDTVFSVTSVYTNAFNGSSELNSITLPNSIASIGSGAFYGCTGLQSIYLDAANPYFLFTNGILYNKSKSQIICCLTNTTGKIEIPQTVTTILSGAFYGCTGIKSVVIPNSVNTISSQVFYNCTGLTDVIIGDSTNTGNRASVSIQSTAFNGCSGLTTLSINVPIASYYYPFNDLPSLKTLAIGNSVTTIDNALFSALPELSKVIVGQSKLNPANITVAPGAFKGSSKLDSLILNCNLQITNYINNATSPFSSISVLAIGEKVSSIGNSVFNGCTKLINVNVSNGVTSIGNNAFVGCTSVTDFTLGSSVSQLGTGVFTGCSSLLNINANSSNVNYSSLNGVLFSFDKLTLIQYPAGRIGSYEIPSQVKTIGTNAFLSCTGLQSVIIPPATTSIQSSAFGSCSGLTQVTIGHADSISTAAVTISGDAFTNCTAITTLTLNKAIYYTSSDNSPFKNLTALTALYVGNKVGSILDYAFSGCTGLKLVRLGQNNGVDNNVVAVSASAFSGCTNFSTLELNRNITITKYASPFTTILNLTVGNGVTSIGSQAFYKCINIESVVLPSSVQKIGSSAFQDCSKLQSATFSGVDSIGSGAFGGCTALTNIVIPNTVKNIQETVFSGCTGLTSITLGNATTQIGGRAFYGCSHLASIVIPNSVQVIYENAFQSCSGLMSVTLGTSLSKIKSYAFSGCSSLLSIQFPGSLISIEDNAFENCKGLTSLFIPSTIRSIGASTFTNCTGITTITIGDANNPGLPLSFNMNSFVGCTGVLSLIQNKDITNTAYSPFMGLSTLTNVTISTYVSHLNDFAFWGCTKIATLNIPNSVKSVGAAAFYNCSSLTDIKLPDNLQNIPNSLFWGCTKLKNLTIPSSVVVIGNYAFCECSSLTSLTIPKNVIAIGGAALSGCTGLTGLTISRSIPPALGTTCFDRVATSICKLYVPTGSKITYQNAKQWKDFVNITEKEIEDVIQTPDLTVYPDPITGSTKAVTIDAGGLKSALTTTELATINKLNIAGTINASDFLIIRDYMPDLTILDLSNATIVAYMGTKGTGGNDNISYPANGVPVNAFFNQSAFTGKTSLVSIMLPKTVTSVGENAFRLCGGLCGAVPLPPLVTSIGNNAYQSCTQLNGILTIPSSVTFIGEGAFAQCTGLNSITIPLGITSIEYATFYHCNRLIMINIPSSVTAIKNSAFYECGELISLDIPSSVTSIGNNAFVYCGLASVTLPPSITTIEDYTFTECHALQSITIPEGVKSIGGAVFLKCYSLTNVSLPSSLTSIGNQTFSDCRNISTIYAYPTTPIVLTDYSTFYSVDKSTCILYVPKGSLTAYQKADQWKDFLNIREMTVTDVNQQIRNSIDFYPNPVKDRFIVNGLTESGILTLTNLNGSVVLTKQITADEYTSISNLPKGIYIAKIETKSFTTEHKIIKR